MKDKNLHTNGRHKIFTSWGSLYQKRKQVLAEYPDFWNISIVKRHFDVIIKHLSNESKVLDIGSFNREFGAKAQAIFPKLIYKSLDVDEANYHDYYSIQDIKETFNRILMCEVLEHLEFSQGTELLCHAFDLLENGGMLFITTPNVYHPHRYWEYSHKIPYRYDELGGILIAAGYEILSIHRIYNDSFFKRLLRLYVMRYLHKYLSIDFAKSIIIVARKP